MTRRVFIDWDLENLPVEIKTDSTIGSNDYVLLYFCHELDYCLAGFFIKFSSTPQYKFEYCSFWNDFPTALPSATEKIWRITLDKSEGIRVIIHCNGVLVLNLLLSDETCTTTSNYGSRWRTFWTKDVKLIYFTAHDTASDYYRLHQGNYCILTKLHCFVFTL